MEFLFTPRTLVQLEKASGKNFAELIGDYSLTTMCLLVQYGKNVKESESYDIIGDYLKEGGELHALFMDAVEGLQDGGFLPKTLKAEEMREEVDQKIAEASESVGKKEK